MNKIKETIRVKKTDKLDQRKLTRVARKFSISPLSVRELQLGFSEDIPIKAAELLINAGYVEEVKTKKRTNKSRVDSLSNPEDDKSVEKPEEDSTLFVSPSSTEVSDPGTEEEENL